MSSKTKFTSASVSPWQHQFHFGSLGCPFTTARAISKEGRKEVKSFSHVQLFATPWTVAHQAPLSMGLSRQEYWSGLPFPSPGDLPDPGIEPRSPALQTDTLLSEPPGKPAGAILSFISKDGEGRWLLKVFPEERGHFSPRNSLVSMVYRFTTLPRCSNSSQGMGAQISVSRSDVPSVNSQQ